MPFIHEHLSFILILIAALPLCGEVDRATPTYVLGPDDQIVIHAPDIDEIKPEPVRIDMHGNINLPLVGRMHVAGNTVEHVEDDLGVRLKTWLRAPQVTVSIVEFRSQPVSVLGAVNSPGVLQIQGRKSLFEVLSQAGGLRGDAGNSVNITRRKEWGPIPLANAKDDSTGHFSVAKVRIKSIMEAKNPRENVEIRANDVISVPKAELVYVIGAVRKPGGFVLSENETLSVLEALSLAEGLDHAAAPRKGRILRASEGMPQRAEIPVDVRQILAGAGRDVPLEANDILFIPGSASQNIAVRSLEAAIQIGTGVAVYRR